MFHPYRWMAKLDSEPMATKFSQFEIAIQRCEG